MRTFLLTLVIVDDIVALLVIALAYTSDLSWAALAVAVALFGVVLALRAAGVRHGVPYFIVGLAMWIATLASGVHATIAGVAVGLLATAYPPSRESLTRGRRPVAPVPRGADPAVRPHGQPVAGAVGVAERAAAAPVPPVDQLRGRAALRPGQRRA